MEEQTTRLSQRPWLNPKKPEAESEMVRMLRDAFDRACPKIKNLPPGVTIHAIEHTQTFGAKKSIEGELLVEFADGTIRRLTGTELSEWSDSIGQFLKKWRLPHLE